MQKVIDILEQYVEWIVLAIASLFLLFIVAFYLIGTPVKGTFAGRTVTPSNVEEQVQAQGAQPLEQAIQDPRVPTMNIEAYAQAFTDHMAMKQSGVRVAQGRVFVPGGAPVGRLRTADEQRDTSPSPTAVAVVAELPAPTWFGSSAGKSNVRTEPGAIANPGMGMGYDPYGGGGPPDMYGGGPPDMYGGWMPPTGGMPTAPGAAAPRVRRGAGAGGVAAADEPSGPGGDDKVWVTQAFAVSADDLTDAFEAAKLPPTAGTMFLRLEVQRQELMPDGTWGNETTITPMEFHQVPEYPKAGAAVDERIYTEWASRNQQTILAPSFYPWVAGDRWWAPGQQNPNKVTEVRPVQQPIQRPGIRGRGGAVGPDMYPGAGGMQPQPRGRQRSYQVRDGRRPVNPMGPGGMPPEAYEAMMQAQMQAEMGMYGGDPYGQGFPGSLANAQAIPEGFVVPSGTFIPAELEGDIFVMVHDDTVQPGKTYRYRMAYRLRNPVYGNTQLAADEAAAKQFAIVSPFSDWGSPISVDQTTRFFIAANPAPGANTVKFDVYRWQDGEWRMKQFTTPVGDIIGGRDGRIDYSTGWTLADVNAGSTVLRDEPVTLADAGGALHTRGFRGDAAAVGGFKREVDYRDPSAPRPAMQPGMMGGYDPSMDPSMMGGYDPSMMDPSMGGRQPARRPRR